MLTATKFRTSLGIVHDRSCLFQEVLPVARIAEELLDFALAIVIIKQPDVKLCICLLQVREQLVVLICVFLHRVVPLFKLVILCANLVWWVYYFDFDIELLLAFKLLKVILKLTLLNELLIRWWRRGLQARRLLRQLIVCLILALLGDYFRGVKEVLLRCCGNSDGFSNVWLFLLLKGRCHLCLLNLSRPLLIPFQGSITLIFTLDVPATAHAA